MSTFDEIDRVIRLEIETLNDLRSQLNDVYTQAVDLILECTGKVVVTGVGKSGLVAQKIAATMVSTGTSAVFLHPADGLHGDVGLIREDDVVLALSKSGETDELLGILPYIKSLGVPLISITAYSDSSLAAKSDLVLFTPVKEEACPLDLAPTSSTTAALVVGDAIAMALMKCRDFTPANFALRHPGGRLGKQLLLTVADVMRSGKNNPVVNTDSTVENMFSEITSQMCGAVSIVGHNNHLVGLITDYDIRAVLERKLDIFEMTVLEIMNPNPISICSDEMATKAIQLMGTRTKTFSVLPVVERDTNSVVGMLHIHDLIAKGL